MQTSGKPWLAATISEVRRLPRASLRVSHIGICEPVSTTGLARPSSMNDNAEAV